ncbi:gamma-glutamyl phosphate reductase GPR [Ceraceosorus guamensis]|uniref:glutamate-5-semialdehyde dehydrogenase n=1 Tax=Ceraceosorus guamensis TaxID=1522189 RepID=A0A316VTX9_9BASI|nr:gamma-glutamyl phosphate reductase GPR [Ceraceosorus guamensis]PWN40664.1 gamma-glutamyl phosphate reductase GPR [Ceraceosorus guamensis]
MTVISVPDIAARAKAAFDRAQATLPAGQAADDARNEALSLIRRKLVESESDVKAANAKDVAAAKEAVSAGKLSPQLLARLDLFVKNKWNDMLEGISSVAALESPLDKCLWAKRLAAPHRESGAGELDLYRLTCPIGVLLCIFEARPEVVVNIATLALKSGNAAILKGGKESTHTSTLLARLVSEALSESKLPADLIQSVESREQVAELLTEDKYVDLVIPRGSNELVRSIQRDARMPVMGHADGLCAAYVHSDAAEESTIKGVVDSKIDYPAACNAVETLLVHRSQLTKLWPALATALLDANVELRCDPESLEALDKIPGVAPRAQQVKAALPGDFYTEFLDLKLAVKSVSTVQEAIEHINTHGSHHTDAIFCSPLASPSNPTTSAAAVNGHSSAQTQEHEAASQFTRAVSSANVFVNCSTRFADGFRFGLGTEVGISTGKTHARGPVGLEGLVIYKYVARASGSGPHTASSFSNRTRSFAHSELEQQYPAFDLPRPPAQTAPNNAAVNAAPHLTDSLSKSSSEPYLYSQDVHVAGYEPLIPPTLLLHETPLTEEARRTIARGRGEASAVISGKDDRLLVVVGPCSIHSPEEALDYAKRLKDAMPQWPGLVVVMRAYFEKPRTTVGWKGLINDPDINGSFQINRGLKVSVNLASFVALC